jgi:hypothetical protein
MARLPGYDIGVRRAVDKVALAGQKEQDSRDMKAGTRQTGDILSRTSGTEQLE